MFNYGFLFGVGYLLLLFEPLPRSNSLTWFIHIHMPVSGHLQINLQICDIFVSFALNLCVQKSV